MAADHEGFEHLRPLPDGSLTSAEVGILLDRLGAARAENERLRERVDRLEWALMHPTTADAEALRSGLLEASLSGRSAGGEQ